MSEVADQTAIDAEMDRIVGVVDNKRSTEFIQDVVRRDRYIQDEIEREEDVITQANRRIVKLEAKKLENRRRAIGAVISENNFELISSASGIEVDPVILFSRYVEKASTYREPFIWSREFRDGRHD